MTACGDRSTGVHSALTKALLFCHTQSIGPVTGSAAINCDVVGSTPSHVPLFFLRF